MERLIGSALCYNCFSLCVPTLTVLIQQAVAETEARERAVKARNKEIREKLNSLQDAEPADEGAGKDRGHEQRESGVVELTDGRSQPSSGLSSSSESLTDVSA